MRPGQVWFLHFYLNIGMSMGDCARLALPDMSFPEKECLKQILALGVPTCSAASAPSSNWFAAVLSKESWCA